MGEIPINGAKNAALPILCTALLTEGTSRFSNVPKLRDVRTMARLLEQLGCNVSGERELEIVLTRVPGIEQALAQQIVRFIRGLRREDLEKVPGVAETLDWAAALVGMKMDSLDGDVDCIRATMICLLKTEADQKAVSADVVGGLAGQAV